MFLRSQHLSQRRALVHGFSLAGPRERPDWSTQAAGLELTEAPVARARQVHGATALVVDAGGDAGEADALVTAQPGLLVAVVTADCVPVLVAGDGVVAAIHAGWRGIAAGVIPRALEALHRLEGGGAPVVAAIGPCISAEVYEVGEEVVAAIVDAGVPEGVVARRRSDWPKVHADLRAAARHQLLSAGCQEVETLPLCTFGDRRLASYRRDGPDSGRQVSLIGRRG